jgi:ankyrin repeat protein
MQLLKSSIQSRKVFTLHFKLPHSKDMCPSLNYSWKFMASTQTLGGELQATPLLLAAQAGHSVIVELLLAVVNINPDVRAGDCEHGYTPLISACQMGHVSIVQQLLA